jgi:hypothetical protein
MGTFVPRFSHIFDEVQRKHLEQKRKAEEEITKSDEKPKELNPVL